MSTYVDGQRFKGLIPRGRLRLFLCCAGRRRKGRRGHADFLAPVACGQALSFSRRANPILLLLLDLDLFALGSDHTYNASGLHHSGRRRRVRKLHAAFAEEGSQLWKLWVVSCLRVLFLFIARFLIFLVAHFLVVPLILIGLGVLRIRWGLIVENPGG